MTDGAVEPGKWWVDVWVGEKVYSCLQQTHTTLAWVFTVTVTLWSAEFRHEAHPYGIGQSDALSRLLSFWRPLVRPLLLPSLSFNFGLSLSLLCIFIRSESFYLSLFFLYLDCLYVVISSSMCRILGVLSTVATREAIPSQIPTQLRYKV